MSHLIPNRRGQPPRPKVVDHHLLVYDAGDRDNRRFTIDLLRFIGSRVRIFKEMGVVITAHRVTKADLDPEYIQRLKMRGIKSLPALVTPTRVYDGRMIKGFYDENVQRFQKTQEKQSDPDDLLSSFYQNELAIARTKDDDNDSDADNGTGDMMKAFQQRQSFYGGAKPSAPTAAAPVSQNDSGQDEPTPSRSDNLADDDENHLDPDADAFDNLMSKAYWSNQEESMS